MCVLIREAVNISCHCALVSTVIEGVRGHPRWNKPYGVETVGMRCTAL